jgi:hypothetical protein
LEENAKPQWRGTQACVPFPRARPLARSMAGAAMLLLLTACFTTAGTGPDQPHTESMSFDQMGQTDFNRTLTLAMRDNLDSLTILMEKLYRRNPSQWRKTGAPDIETAIAQGRTAIFEGRTPVELGGLRDTAILAVAVDPMYTGDRVAALILGLADMMLRAHGGKTRFYATDMLDAQHVYNAARNVEIAAWLLNTRRDAQGRPLLLANEQGDTVDNLTFEREFGKIIGRLDLIANLLNENLRRVGINYVQGLLFFHFLPVR